MTERERMINLLKESQGDNTYCISDYAADKIADVLLASGVIVLSCKVGDTVYVIHNTAERIELGLSDCIYETVIDSIHVGGTIEYHMYYKRIVYPDCDFFIEKDIGKTIFFTREEAEKALKGGAKNE